jgi:uncharacterized membrane protein YqhA
MNGWTNRETWLMNLWFEYETQAELDDIRSLLEEELDEVRHKLPDYLIDILGVNFVMEEINWDELGGHVEAMP